jgi:hypothetical protein
MGKNNIEDALKRLDRLTQEEAQMASAQLLQITNAIDERVVGVADGVNRIERSWFPNRIHAGHTGSIILTGDQLQQNLRRWLSPQDPSTNHNIACNAHHKGTATWFFEGRTYKEWKSTSSESHSGFMANVCPVPFCRLTPPNDILILAGSGKSILWFVQPSLFLLMITESLVFLQFDNHRRCENHVQFRSSLDGVFLL